MDRMSGTEQKREERKTKFTPADLPKLREMVRLVSSKVLSQHEAAKKYKTTRHQVRKFLNLYADKLFENNDAVVDEALKEKVMTGLVSGRLTMNQAVARYKIEEAVITRWMAGTKMFSKKRIGRHVVSESEIDPAVKLETVRKIQAGKLTQFKAATTLKVTRYSVRTWISSYSMFNLDGSICYRMLEKLNPEEKEKELLKQIEQLQEKLKEKDEQLGDKDLKIEGLETLIKVAV